MLIKARGFISDETQVAWTLHTTYGRGHDDYQYSGPTFLNSLWYQIPQNMPHTYVATCFGLFNTCKPPSGCCALPQPSQLDLPRLARGNLGEAMCCHNKDEERRRRRRRRRSSISRDSTVTAVIVEAAAAAASAKPRRSVGGMREVST